MCDPTVPNPASETPISPPRSAISQVARRSAPGLPRPVSHGGPAGAQRRADRNFRGYFSLKLWRVGFRWAKLDTRDDPVGEAWPTATCHAGNFTRGNSDEDRTTRRHGRRARRVAELRPPCSERMAAIRPERESVPRIVGWSRGNLASGCPAVATGDLPHPPGAHRAAVGAAAATRRRRMQRPAAYRREDHEHAPTAARPHRTIIGNTTRKRGPRVREQILVKAAARGRPGRSAAHRCPHTSFSVSPARRGAILQRTKNGCNTNASGTITHPIAIREVSRTRCKSALFDAEWLARILFAGRGYLERGR